MISSERYISAADYQLFLTCPRSLHYRLTGQAIPPRFEADAHFPLRADRAIVRDLARTLFPGGVALEAPTADTLASRAVAEHQVLFGACCGRDPFAACADVLHPQKPDGLAAVLVRETTSIKEAHIIDAAFLLWNFRACDVPLEKLYIYHLRKHYEHDGVIDPGALFSVHDVTRRAAKRLERERTGFEELERVLAEDPTLERFAQTPCKRPRHCPLCSSDLPSEASTPWGRKPAPGDDLSTLFKGGKLVRELREEGYTTIAEVPESRLSDRRHRVQQRALQSGKAQIDPALLTRFLASLEYPLHFLDFEATSEALPRFPSVRPWEHVAYLYSLHQQPAPGAELTHRDFVMMPGRDERREMVEDLLEHLGRSGSVVVYSAGFEQGILSRLADAVPEHAAALSAVRERVVDLLQPFTEFAYYHHNQRGKLSLKRVLPLLTNKSYAEESVADGYTANVAYRYLSENAARLAADERDSVLADLRSYCRMDTRAMVAVLEALRSTLVE